MEKIIYVNKSKILSLNTLKNLIKELKIIDVKVDGNVVVFFLGNKEVTDYHGDDWGDYSYKDNAGEVYDEYVTFKLIAHYSYAYNRCAEIGNNENGDVYSKNDFKQHLAPICSICKGTNDELTHVYNDFDEVSHVPNSILFYYDDNAIKILENNYNIVPITVELFSVKVK